jgi:hypothetical protein
VFYFETTPYYPGHNDFIVSTTEVQGDFALQKLHKYQQSTQGV